MEKRKKKKIGEGGWSYIYIYIREDIYMVRQVPEVFTYICGGRLCGNMKKRKEKSNLIVTNR